MLNENFQKYYDPDEIVCVDKSLTPFRGCTILKQYIKQNQHKQGIQIMCGSGIHNRFSNLLRKEADAEKTTLTNVVMTLC